MGDAWAAGLRAAARMGIAPSVFWALSVREWLALVADVRRAGLSRAELGALMARFPDDRSDA